MVEDGRPWIGVFTSNKKAGSVKAARPFLKYNRCGLHDRRQLYLFPPGFVLELAPLIAPSIWPPPWGPAILQTAHAGSFATPRLLRPFR